MVSSCQGGTTPFDMQGYEKWATEHRLTRSAAYQQPDLITGKVLERCTTKRALLDSCRDLAELAGKPHLDKSEVPIMATAGIGGSGKTTFLNLIRFGVGGECWHNDVLDAIKVGRPEIQELVVIMATMNQTTTFCEDEAPMPALISRLFADVT